MNFIRQFVSSDFVETVDPGFLYKTLDEADLKAQFGMCDLNELLTHDHDSSTYSHLFLKVDSF